MLLIAAAAVVAASAADLPPPRSGAVVQARASVHILKGARVRLTGTPAADGAVPRPSSVRIDGARHPARLIEFE